MTTQYEIGVIGAGNAAEGIVHGILRNTLLFADRMIASDPQELRRTLFAERFGIDVTADNLHLVDSSYILILAIKPPRSTERAICKPNKYQPAMVRMPSSAQLNNAMFFRGKRPSL